MLLVKEMIPLENGTRHTDHEDTDHERCFSDTFSAC